MWWLYEALKKATAGRKEGKKEGHGHDTVFASRAADPGMVRMESNARNSRVAIVLGAARWISPRAAPAGLLSFDQVSPASLRAFVLARHSRGHLPILRLLSIRFCHRLPFSVLLPPSFSLPSSLAALTSPSASAAPSHGPSPSTFVAQPASSTSRFWCFRSRSFPSPPAQPVSRSSPSASTASALGRGPSSPLAAAQPVSSPPLLPHLLHLVRSFSIWILFRSDTNQ